MQTGCETYARELHSKAAAGEALVLLTAMRELRYLVIRSLRLRFECIKASIKKKRGREKETENTKIAVRSGKK